MEYAVFLISGMIIGQWLSGRSKKKNNVTPGRSYYMTHGIINLIGGAVGAVVLSFLGDIIPKWAFWTGMAEFGIVMCIGIYEFVKEGRVEEP